MAAMISTRIGAAQQPVDADLGGDLRRMHRRLGAGGDHLHIARGAGVLDRAVDGMEGLLVDAHILEADMAEPDAADLLHHLEPVEHGLVLAGEHEDEIHRGVS